MPRREHRAHLPCSAAHAARKLNALPISGTGGCDVNAPPPSIARIRMGRPRERHSAPARRVGMLFSVRIMRFTVRIMRLQYE